MANQIEIDIVARDLASGVFNSITSSMGSLGGVIQGIATGNYLQAITSGFQFMSEAVSETVSYIDEVDDMSRAIGVTVEESSRLIQASERLGLEQNNLQAALEFATKKGIDVSIVGLKQLSTEYTNIQDPVDQASYLVKIFGQNAEDMSKMMELGADGIDKALGSVNDWLVVTEDAVKANNEYKAATEDLTDAWMGFKVKIGTAIIPLLTQITSGVTAGVGVIQNAARTQREYNQAVADLGITWYQGIGYVYEGNRVTVEYVDSMVRGAQTAEIFTNGLGGVYTQMGNLVTNSPNVVQGIADIDDAVEELSITIANADLNIASKIQRDFEASQFLAAGGGLVQQLQTRFHEGIVGGTITDEEAAGVFQPLFLAAQAVEMEMGKSKDAVIADIMEVFGVTLGEATALIDAWLDDVDGKTFNLIAKIDYINGNSTPSNFAWSPEYRQARENEMLEAGYDPKNGDAWGGWESANTPYLVGERGPELFVPGTSGKIIPNNQLGGGGGVEIDYDRFARIIAQEFQKVSR